MKLSKWWKTASAKAAFRREEKKRRERFARLKKTAKSRRVKTGKKTNEANHKSKVQLDHRVPR
jgi:hypothetical protein